MGLPFTFATMAAGAVPASDLDTNFTVIAGMGVVQCTATGTNTVALTPVTNMPTIAAYTNLQLFSFVPAANTNGSVQVNVSAVGALNLYLPNGVTQAGSGDLSTAGTYLIQYLASLNSGGGGFIIVGLYPNVFLLNKTGQPFSGGIHPTGFSGGTIGSGGSFIPDSGNGPLQFITNSGAAGGLSLGVPTTSAASLVLLITNGASAGTITASGYTVSSNTGDALTTTNGSKFMLQIVAINSVATYIVKALQ